MGSAGSSTPHTRISMESAALAYQTIVFNLDKFHPNFYNSAALISGRVYLDAVAERIYAERTVTYLERFSSS